MRANESSELHKLSGGLDDVIFLILNGKLPSLGTSNVSLLIQRYLGSIQLIGSCQGPSYDF